MVHVEGREQAEAAVTMFRVVPSEEALAVDLSQMCEVLLSEVWFPERSLALLHSLAAAAERERNTRPYATLRDQPAYLCPHRHASSGDSG